MRKDMGFCESSSELNAGFRGNSCVSSIAAHRFSSTSLVFKWDSALPMSDLACNTRRQACGVWQAAVATRAVASPEDAACGRGRCIAQRE